MQLCTYPLSALSCALAACRIDGNDAGRELLSCGIPVSRLVAVIFLSQNFPNIGSFELAEWGCWRMLLDGKEEGMGMGRAGRVASEVVVKL